VGSKSGPAKLESSIWGSLDDDPLTFNNVTLSSKDMTTESLEELGFIWSGESNEFFSSSTKNRTSLKTDCFQWTADDKDATKSITNSSETSAEQDLKNVKSLFIQMEYCEQDLKEYMDSSSKSELWSNHLQIMEQLMKGLDHMHSQHNIFHRDIKPKNILLNLFPLRVKLGDFGLATQTRSLDDLLTGNANLSIGVGTMFWVSPEQRNGSEYGPKSDIFSVGLVIFEVLFCKYWSTNSERSFCFRNFKSSFTTPKINQSDHSVVGLALEMIKQMVHPNPGERPSAREVLLRIECCKSR